MYHFYHKQDKNITKNHKIIIPSQSITVSFLLWGKPPFLSVSQTKAGNLGKPCAREGAKGKGRIKGRAGTGTKKKKAVSGIM